MLLVVGGHHLRHLLVAHRHRELATLAQLHKLLVAHAQISVAVVVDEEDIDAVAVTLRHPAHVGALQQRLVARPYLGQARSCRYFGCHTRKQCVGREVIHPVLLNRYAHCLLNLAAESHRRQPVVAADIVLSASLHHYERVLLRVVRRHVDDVYCPWRKTRAGMLHHEGRSLHIERLHAVGHIHHLHLGNERHQRPLRHSGEKALGAPVGGQCHYRRRHNLQV